MVGAVSNSNPVWALSSLTARAGSVSVATDGQGGWSASAVSVSLSVQALAAMKQAPDNNPYWLYFPTREGFSSEALWGAITDPGAESSSAGLTREQAADDARARMDAKYAAMEAQGKAFDVNSFEGMDQYTLFGDLDRRSLNAVAENVGGQFTDQERLLARSIMQQQQSFASGSYWGPIRTIDTYRPTIPKDDWAGRAMADMRFLAQVSEDEKSTVSWAMLRASAEVRYEMETNKATVSPVGVSLTYSEVRAPLSIGRPLVELIKSALKRTDGENGGFSHPGLNLGWTEADLKRQPFMKGFDHLIGQAISLSSRVQTAGVAA